MAPELLDESDIVGFTDAPSENEAMKLTEMGRELLDTDTQIKDAEKLVERLKKRRLELAMDEIPKYMVSVGQDRIGLMGSGLDVVLEPYYHANIASDWTAEKRDAAFSYLEETGNGDLIKTVVTVTLGRGELELATEIAAIIKASFEKIAEIARGVSWNTLTAFVKEQVEAGRPIDLDVLGAQVGQIAKLKKRK